MRVPVQYVDEVSQDAFENFIVSELDAGKKITSLNSRIRGLRVFFKFCAEREYMKPITLKLMKEDETIKEPYTDAELRRLLKRPEGNSWVEWRTWASINYLIATGNRASTLLNVKISDVDFENMTIHLVKTKSRKQQIIPLSPALKQILLDYLKTWEWTTDDYLFPSNEGHNSICVRFKAQSDGIILNAACQRPPSTCSVIHLRKILFSQAAEWFSFKPCSVMPHWKCHVTTSIFTAWI